MYQRIQISSKNYILLLRPWGFLTTRPSYVAGFEQHVRVAFSIFSRKYRLCEILSRSNCLSSNEIISNNLKSYIVSINTI